MLLAVRQPFFKLLAGLFLLGKRRVSPRRRPASTILPTGPLSWLPSSLCLFLVGVGSIAFIMSKAYAYKAIASVRRKNKRSFLIGNGRKCLRLRGFAARVGQRPRWKSCEDAKQAITILSLHFRPSSTFLLRRRSVAQPTYLAWRTPMLERTIPLWRLKYKMWMYEETPLRGKWRTPSVRDIVVMHPQSCYEEDDDITWWWKKIFI